MPKKTRAKKVEFSEEDIKQMEGMVAIGLTYSHIASYYGVDDKTFYNYREQNPGLNSRLTKAKIGAAAKLMQSGYQRAFTDATMYRNYFNLQGRWLVRDIEANDNKIPIDLEDDE